ncbi:MAG: NADH oxidoreductase (quinone) subunit F [Spirochaetes bacterium]|nr:MAG: NADH oxidoreductase (quinone) subunit F [Spirochaetota bacterium]
MERPLTQHIRPDRSPLSISEYEKTGGYQAARKALKTMDPKSVTDTVINATLRGRGGAGFSTGRKWSFIPKDAPPQRYLVVNADEMEPGTFKDRLLLEGNPHQLIEGMIIAAFAIQADTAYIFLRRAYRLAAARLEKALAEARAAGYLGKNIFGSGRSLEIHVHMSAGRYICGEETALINALEGRRANPRSKPPFPQISGLFGKPTIVNNVETLCNVPHIIGKGVDWFKSLALTEDGGTKLYGASGKVKKPGLWELPLGTSAREILEEHAGGMRDGLKFKGLLPGGASTDFLVEKHLDLPMDFNALGAAGSRLGTGTMIVMDDRTCPVGFVHNLIRFFAQESCGWCTPCREGLPWVEKTLAAIEAGKGKDGDVEILEMHAKALGMGNTYCALAPGAMEPLASALLYFRDDFTRHIKEQGCPWR